MANRTGLQVFGSPVADKGIRMRARTFKTDVVPQVLSGANGDALVVETWLRLCDAMSDDRGAIQLVDLNIVFV